MANNVYVFGNGGPGGTYALRLRTSQSISVNLGKQKKIRNTLLDGEMIYIGSARADRGASTLCHRLNRHATRRQTKTPHEIRENIRESLFNDKSWEKRGRGRKKFKWGIDYFLDHPYARLDAVYAFQHLKSRNVEHSLAIRIDADSGTHVIKPDLGSQDWNDGFSHFLGICADEVWWRLLEVRMKALACKTKKGAQTTELVESYLRGHDCLQRLGGWNYQSISFAKGTTGRKAVAETVEILAERESVRAAKLEKMKEKERKERDIGKDPGMMCLYPFPKITEALVKSDTRFAMAVERLRRNCGGQILNEIFSFEPPKNRKEIERQSRSYA